MTILELPEKLTEYLCTVKATMFGERRAFNVSVDLNINYDVLETQMDSFPQVYHMWSMVSSELKEQLDTLETQIKKRRSALIKLILDETGGKIRKSDIDSMIDCDERLTELEAQKIMMEKSTRKLYYTLEALKMKNDNMRSLFGFKKREFMSS